jgi:hypothetical protein
MAELLVNSLWVLTRINEIAGQFGKKKVLVVFDSNLAMLTIFEMN